MVVNETMKGRIECPKCKNEFVAHASSDAKEQSVLCPHCSHRFIVKVINDTMTQKTTNDSECSWEEHGEPRKTILSSMKPRTDKPMLAAVLLIIVVLIGLISAALPQQFAETPITILSIAGINEDIIITLQDPRGDAISDVTLSFSSSISEKTNTTGKTILHNLPLGMQTITLSQNTSTTTVSLYVNPLAPSSHTIVLNESTFTASTTDSTDDLSWISGIIVLFSMIALLGAISSIRRRHSDVAIIGSIVGIFTIGFFLSGSILSIIALYLILQSKEEFDDGKKGKSF